jgi:hypothetical protein
VIPILNIDPSANTNILGVIALIWVESEDPDTGVDHKNIIRSAFEIMIGSVIKKTIYWLRNPQNGNGYQLKVRKQQINKIIDPVRLRIVCYHPQNISICGGIDIEYRYHIL